MEYYSPEVNNIQHMHIISIDSFKLILPLVMHCRVWLHPFDFILDASGGSMIFCAWCGAKIRKCAPQKISSYKYIICWVISHKVQNSMVTSLSPTSTSSLLSASSLQRRFMRQIPFYWLSFFLQQIFAPLIKLRLVRMAPSVPPIDPPLAIGL